MLRLRPVVGVVLRRQVGPPLDLALDGVVEIQVNVVLFLHEPEKRSVPPTPSHHAASSQPPLLAEKALARARVIEKDGTRV